MLNSDGEEDIGIIQSSLGITHLSMSKSGEVTATSETGKGSGTAVGVGAGTGKGTSNVNVPEPVNILRMGIDKTDSILMKEQKEEEIKLTSVLADNVEIDLSILRGIQPPPETKVPANNNGNGGIANTNGNNNANGGNGERPRSSGDKMKVELNGEQVQDLEGLSELVPGLKTGQVGANAVTVAIDPDEGKGGAAAADASKMIPHLSSMVAQQGNANIENGDEASGAEMTKMNAVPEDESEDTSSNTSQVENDAANTDTNPSTAELIKTYNAKPIIRGIDDQSESSDDSKSTAAKTHSSRGEKNINTTKPAAVPPPIPDKIQNNHNDNQNHLQHPYSQKTEERLDITTPPRPHDESMYGSTPIQGDFNPQSSVASMGETATLSHNEMRMPMYLPTFRPATGCTNASDFIVRCFVARLRSGITVVKHGRSRWCKSRLRILHVHSDGRSLSWKPAQGEPTSSKRPPKLDLSTCLEVRHAWSPDPLNPMFTGTPILRSKCEASNAFKSFALIFPRRTVDITAVTADQCKVLMEGFSALCFRLQVANMGRGSRTGSVTMAGEDREARTGKEERGNATAATISLSDKR
jgi:hypothetical protein